MAQVLDAGLAEILREHEEKIAAAHAWCKQQNIRSIDELKSQGETAADEFVKAVGAVHRAVKGAAAAGLSGSRS